MPNSNRSLSESNFIGDELVNQQQQQPHHSNIDDRLLREKREIVAKLERQNREIAKEIKRLRIKQIASNQSLEFDEVTTKNSVNTGQSRCANNNNNNNYQNIYATVTHDRVSPF